MTENDSIKKHQAPIGEVTCIISKNPELDVVVNKSEIPKEVPKLDCSDSTEPFVLAPGEGMVPTNIMRDKDWDTKGWPCLHPSGKYGLYYNREVPISEILYTKQRLHNKNTSFANNPSWIFAIQQFLERNAIERQIDVAFQKGKIETTGSSVKVLSDHDAYSFFKSIRGTPKYWQMRKNDLLAMIEQLGPFHCFLTLSAAEKRWPEVIIAILEKDGHKITQLCGLWKFNDKKKLINRNGSWTFGDKKWIKEQTDDGFLLKLSDDPDKVLCIVDKEITNGLEVTIQSKDESTGGQIWDFVNPDDYDWGLLQNRETGFFLTASSFENSKLTVTGKLF